MDDAPDSIFPDWFMAFKINGKSVLVIFPMKHPSRRRERQTEIIDELKKKYPLVIDLTDWEK